MGYKYGLTWSYSYSNVNSWVLWEHVASCLHACLLTAMFILWLILYPFIKHIEGTYVCKIAPCRMVSLGIMKHGQNLFSFNFPHIKKCYIRMMLSDELEIRFRYIEALTVSISNRVPFSFSSGKVKSLEHCARNQF